MILVYINGLLVQHDLHNFRYRVSFGQFESAFVSSDLVQEIKRISGTAPLQVTILEYCEGALEKRYDSKNHLYHINDPVLGDPAVCEELMKTYSLDTDDVLGAAFFKG